MMNPELEARLRQLVDVFLTENRKLNLSAFRTPEHCWVGNVLDSVHFLDVAPVVLGEGWQSAPCRIADVGTGGGFPLLPLALALPKAHCVGMDGVRKKIDAVGRMVKTLELDNVELRCGRVEEFARDPALRASFHVATVRAVASISVLLEYLVPLLKVGGHCVLWKSTRIADELRASSNAMRALSAKLVGEHTYDLPEDWGQRTLLIFQKTAMTAEEYPRGVGIPKKTPL